MSPMFVPGPVDVDPDVLGSQAQPMLPHRSKEFEEIFQRAAQRAQEVFLTGNRVLITASSGTGLQEAAVRNLSRERILSCVNGAFGSRWYDVAVSNGKQVTKLEFPWQQPVDPSEVAQALSEGAYDLVTVVHNETSTGLENHIAAIAESVREAAPEALIAVDAVSSLGGARIDTDAWGLDMVLTSSQKALALPPGLGLAAVSDRAMEYADSVPNRGWYFDLVRLEKHRIKDSTPATPALSLIYALDVQLARILEEGLEQRFDRHRRMAERVAEWAESLDFSLFAPEGYRSKTVTTIENARGMEIPLLNHFLLQRDMRLAGGYGPLKGKTFRIAHMGETDLDDIETLLAALEEYLDTQ